MSDFSVGLPPSRSPWLPLVLSAGLGDACLSAILGITGAGFVWQSSVHHLGTVAQPGPGFFPFLVGVIMVFLSTIAAIGRARPSKPDHSVQFGHRDVLITLGCLLLVPLAFEAAGAYVTLGLLGTVLLVLIARMPSFIAIPLVGIGMAACWYFFQVLLGVQLPLGTLFGGVVDQ